MTSQGHASTLTVTMISAFIRQCVLLRTTSWTCRFIGLLFWLGAITVAWMTLALVRHYLYGW